jgi:ABC-type sulfate transport system substrate-binding protein
VLQIIVANPKTAGVARWIFLALWGSKMKKGDAAAIAYVTKVTLRQFLHSPFWCMVHLNGSSMLPVQ